MRTETTLTPQNQDKAKPFLNKANRIFFYLAFILVVTRCLFVFTGYLGKNIFSDFTVPSTYQEVAKGQLNMKLPATLGETKKLSVSDLAKYDTNWYFGIIRDGYLKADIHHPHRRANWVFYPLFPASVWALSKIIPLDLTTISVVFSNALFFLALVYLTLFLRKRNFLENQIKTAIFLIAIYPTSFYFSLPYTESLFLFLSAATIYYGFEKKYLFAFIAAGLSAATRPPGVLNILLATGLMAVDTGFKPNRQMFKLLAYFVLSLIPLGIFLAYMEYLTGSFFAPFKEQYINWYKVRCIPFTSYINYFRFKYFLSPGGWNEGLTSFVMTTTVLATFIAYLGRSWRKVLFDIRELGFFLYGLALIAMPFATTDIYMVSVIRYSMVSIPFFVYLTELSSESESIKSACTVLFILLSTLFTVAFYNNYYFIV